MLSQNPAGVPALRSLYAVDYRHCHFCRGRDSWTYGIARMGLPCFLGVIMILTILVVLGTIAEAVVFSALACALDSFGEKIIQKMQ